MPPTNLKILEFAERTRNDDFKKMVLDKFAVWMKKKKDYPLYAKVIIATYIRPRKTAGGIIIPELTADQDRYQGKVGLILKMGPNAFDFDGNAVVDWKKTKPPKIGDYILHHSSDAREVGILGHSCKVIDSSMILSVVDDPEDYY